MAGEEGGYSNELKYLINADTDILSIYRSLETDMD